MHDSRCDVTSRPVALIILRSEQGLPEECAASCDSLLTVPKDRLERSPVVVLGPDKIIELDRALRFAVEINY
jgi:hypothetical protein